MNIDAAVSPLPEVGASVTVGSFVAKTRIPRPYAFLVPRSQVLQRLSETGDRRCISIAAPAGYGKTSAVVTLAASNDGRTAWVTLDEADNDPATFLSLLTASISHVVPVEPSLLGAIRSRAVPARSIVGRLLSALAAHDQPLLLVLDDAHFLVQQDCLDSLAEFVTYLPEGCRVALVGREPLRLPLERWRLGGLLTEIGVEQLAMGESEAQALVRQFDVDLSDDAIRRLTQLTEGWPALLTLMIAAIRRTGDVTLSSDLSSSRQVSDYLRAELLEHRAASDVEFMTRTSILDRVSGPLCDAVLQRQGSQAVLQELGRSTLLVDDYGGWYRFHPILRDFLRHELDAREPALAADLHRRAVSWYDAAGEAEFAVEHAFGSGDRDLAALMVGKSFTRLHWDGRRATLRAWLHRFDRMEFKEHPWLAVLAAYEAMSAGDVGDAERHLDMADEGGYRDTPPDGSASLESGLALVRAVQCRRGVPTMLADAAFAVTTQGSSGPWSDFARWVLSLAHFAAGDRESGRAALGDALAAAQSGINEGLLFSILGHHALEAQDRQDWDVAAAFMHKAGAISQPGRFDGYPSAVLARVAAIRMLQQDGDVRAVREALAGTASLRLSLSAASPVISVMGLLGFARLHLAIGDPGGARAVLMQAGDILRLRPDLGVLPAEVEALRSTLAGLPIGLGGATTLTTAELRVLLLLPYYLSFKEIAQRLGVKATTIKTHALAIYGKLGASSRGEAIDLAVDVGLLERFPTQPR